MGRPRAIEVRDLTKTFSVPTARRSGGPLAGLRSGRQHRNRGALEVFRGISFDVGRGEFFGVVGRNGCGKSTLLALLAGVYRADGGSVRVAGRLAPMLELGLGFNPALAARDNVLLNAVMLGLTPREARRRSDEVIEFAGLTDFVEMPIRNYSSGMKVRLGFAVMVSVDADVLLIDEVLAVGDAEFQERCGDAFVQMHREGKTVVLVTHSMSAVTGYCERAMLLHNGSVDTIGAPDRVAERYYEVNLSAILARPDNTLPEMSSHIVSAIAEPKALLDDCEVIDDAGLPIGHLQPPVPIKLRALIAVERELADLGFVVRIAAADGRVMFVSDRVTAPAPGEVRPGNTLEVTMEIENLLPAGRHTVFYDVFDGEVPAGPTRISRLEIDGDDHAGGMRLPHRATMGAVGVGSRQ